MTPPALVEQGFTFALSDGVLVRVRPIRHDDEIKMVEFHRTLSDHTVYMRYFYLMGLPFRVSHERLAKVCTFDPESQLVFVAEIGEGVSSKIVAVGRLMPGDSRRDKTLFSAETSGHEETEFALLIADAYQKRGIGRRLLTHLIEVSRRIGARRIVGEILADNYAMTRLCEQAGFDLHRDPTENTLTATLRLIP